MTSKELIKWGRILSLIGGVLLIVQGILQAIGQNLGPSVFGTLNNVIIGIIAIVLGALILALAYKEFGLSDIIIGILILVLGIIAGGWGALLAIIGGILYILGAIL